MFLILISVPQLKSQMVNTKHKTRLWRKIWIISCIFCLLRLLFGGRQVIVAEHKHLLPHKKEWHASKWQLLIQNSKAKKEPINKRFSQSNLIDNDFDFLVEFCIKSFLLGFPFFLFVNFESVGNFGFTAGAHRPSCAHWSARSAPQMTSVDFIHSST
jgi:hypothetical protein